MQRCNRNFWHTLMRRRESKFPEEYGEEKQEQDQDQPEEGYWVLAVTACPTGIAHTYMAAESLENRQRMGISIKVETQRLRRCEKSY